MSKQILVIGGGEVFETYDEYISYLQNKVITIEKLRFGDWKTNLQSGLGLEFEVYVPDMPNSKNARYAEWKIIFEKILAVLDDTVVLIGHSLGGIFLAKYLSENDLPAGEKIKATFLVAAPFNTENEHPIADFILKPDLSKFTAQGGEIFLYQSKDDPVVPFSNVESFARALPDAHLRIFEDRMHFNQTEFPELIKELRDL